MFSYEICNVFDEVIFSKQCSALEKHIPQLKKDIFAEDVDGSQCQVYTFPDGKTLKVTNDKLVGVEIDSEVDLEQYFSQ